MAKSDSITLFRTKTYSRTVLNQDINATKNRAYGEILDRLTYDRRNLIS